MKRHIKKALEYMMGPTGSIVLHVFIVIAMIRLVYFATAPEDQEVEVVMVDPETIDLEELREELKELEFQQQLDALAPPDMSMDMEMPDVADVQELSDVAETDFSALDVVDNVQSPLVIRGLYANRGEAGRKAALGKFGGSEVTERAVLLALEWLRKNQRPDGFWDKGDGKGEPMQRVGYTGLALLAFLSHGETPDKERYGATVERAIKALAGNQDADGWFANPNADSGHGTYAHAIATYAMSEAYAMTRIPSLKSSIERAATRIVKGQQPGGGFDYHFRNEGRRDTSLGGWCLQAMKAAMMAGAEVPGLKEAMEKGLADFRKVQTPEGFFGYTTPERNITNTGIAVLCFKLLGYGDDPAVKLGQKALEAATVDWDDPGAWALAGWYYITQAKFHEGGNEWSQWNRDFSRVLTRMQNEDGSWLSPSPYEQGHGKTYGTALAALTLQVYYRFLPTYQVDPKAAGAGTPEAAQEEEDLITIL